MPAQYPTIGFPPGSEVDLLRRICNNTAEMAGGSSGGGPVVLVAVPASSAAPGSAGQIAIDDSYLYVYSAAAAGWRRVAINDW